jgi:hypothetical protein
MAIFIQTSQRTKADTIRTGLIVLLATLVTLFCAAAVSAAGRLVVKADELVPGAFDDLVMLPDGSVIHLMRLHFRALFEVYETGDTLVYDIGRDWIIVRRNISPAELILSEPLATVLLEPALFAGIDVANEIAILGDSSGYFYSSFSGYPYSAEVLDGNNRLIYAGYIAQPYTTYQSATNPFQPDSDLDGVPDTADNCIYVANGPLLADAGNNFQLDTNADGFGNACDADLNNDLIINFLDLNLIRDVFFTNPGSPNWNPDADFDGDELVNFVDLDLMRATFFGVPGPSALAP